MGERRRTTNAVDIVHRRYVGGDAERKAALEAARVHAEVARMIHDLRVEAGMSQKELAELIGTTQSVVSRIEDEEYEGHSLSMLNRVAKALNQKLTMVMTAKDPEVDTLRYVFQLTLRDLRRRRGLTIDQLAQKTQIDRRELIAAERVPGYRPTPLTLHRLSEFYGIDEQRLAALAGAFQELPGMVSESALRYAAQSDSFAKLTSEERKALDEFIQSLETGR